MNNKLIFNFVSWKDIFCKLLSHEFCSCVFGSVTLNILLSQLSVAYLCSDIAFSFLFFNQYKMVCKKLTKQFHHWAQYMVNLSFTGIYQNCIITTSMKTMTAALFDQICCLFITCFTLASYCSWGFQVLTDCGLVSVWS